MDHIDTLETLLHAHLNASPVCSEHDLIQQLQKDTIDPFDQLDLKHSKDLFSAHFLIRHVLYKLQTRYLNEKSFLLELGMSEIKRTPYVAGTNALSEHDAVREYYLDIKHYLETSEDDVNDLLKGFWEKYLAYESKDSDFETLGLSPDSSHDEVKKRFRALAQQHHPDKGGDANHFHAIKQAKENLDRLFKTR